METRDDGSGIRCNEHPDAPHGFMRDASHNEGRYVCECEFWKPPKREWVGLTDEEVYQAESGCWFLDEFDKTIFARAIEAKLKEKNT